MTRVVENAEGRVCARTGLRLVRAPSAPVFRIARCEYGPLKPLQRDSGPDRSSWGRWDTANGRTIYAGATALAAYVEVLSYLRENLPQTRLGDVFPEDHDDPEADEPLSAVIRAGMQCPDWIDSLTPGWRLDRRRYKLKLPQDGWFVDINAAESVAALDHGLWSSIGYGQQLTLSKLTGEDRVSTTKIAESIRIAVLDDGSLPFGIKYLSKHGSDLCAFAVWLRAVDDGKALTAEPTKELAASNVAFDDRDLQRAAELIGLRVRPDHSGG